MRNLTRALVSAIALALALTAVAVAAKPQTGTYAGDAISLHVKHGKIVEVTGKAGGNCSSVSLKLKKHIAVKHGKFHFSGKVKNAGGRLTLSGHFKTKKLAKGTYKFVKGSCSTGTKKFTAAIGDAPD
jgi:acid phosphatase class B